MSDYSKVLKAYYKSVLRNFELFNEIKMQSSYPQPHDDRKSGEGASEIFSAKQHCSFPLNSYVAGD